MKTTELIQKIIRDEERLGSTMRECAPVSANI
jgi:hypothetical protein